MEIYYVIDYFLFTFFASFGTLQVALSVRSSKRFNLGIIIVIISYFWFFSIADRNISTVVEGLQLFVIFAVAVLTAIFVTKNFLVLIKKR